MENTSQPTEVTGLTNLTHTSEVSSTDVVGDRNNAYERRQRQKTSKIWNDFVCVEVGGVQKSQCNYFKKLFVVSSSSSTSTLGRHLVLYEICEC